MSAVAAVRRLWAGAARYLDEVSGQAEFRRVCRAHTAAAPGGRLSAKERRALWRGYTGRAAGNTTRCC
ncbi:hypothetical protein AB0D11_39310 [Streptomyces monashensis]|uniref:hypothetical protein n=1 Tax=Streptomyces monashensis TaxID=1678012 RepID=UPI0033EC3AD7